MDSFEDQRIPRRHTCYFGLNSGVDSSMVVVMMLSTPDI